MNPSVLPNHLIIAPILIPLVAGAIMLFYNDRNRQTKLLMGLVAVALTFLVSLELVADVKSGVERGSTVVGLYRLGDWPVPIGIVLVLDRLSVLMVMLTALLAGPSLIYAAAGWHGKGQHYHSMFQFLLAMTLPATTTPPAKLASELSKLIARLGKICLKSAMK